MATKKRAALPAGDTRPDAWDRFERAVDAGIKSGPKHKPAKKKAKASKRVSSREKP
jgi:hypothetical protein